MGTKWLGHTRVGGGGRLQKVPTDKKLPEAQGGSQLQASRVAERHLLVSLPCLLVPDLPIEANLLCSAIEDSFYTAHKVLLLLCCSYFQAAAHPTTLLRLVCRSILLHLLLCKL